MKKRYAIVASALLALAASAAPIAKQGMLLDIAKAPANAVPQLTLREDVKEMAKAPVKRSTTLSDFSGKFVQRATIDDEVEFTHMALEKKSESDYIIKDWLFGKDALDVPATLLHDYDYDIDFMSVAPATPICRDGYYEWKVYLYGKNKSDGKYYYYPDSDIQFFQDAEGNLIYPYTDSGMMAAYIDPSNGKLYGMIWLNPSWYRANSTLTATEVVGYDSNDEPVLEPVDNYFFTEYNKENDNICLVGFSDCEHKIELTVDKENNTLSGADQLALYRYVGNSLYGFYLSNSSEGYTFTAPVTDTTDNTTTLTIPYFTIINREVGWYSYMLDATVNLPFNVMEPNGISSVAADCANGPAEYFNLQGQRVTTPKAGELVIKRQGNKVVKEIAR